MHIFPYSIRPGTPAAEMEQVPKAVKEPQQQAIPNAGNPGRTNLIMQALPRSPYHHIIWRMALVSSSEGEKFFISPLWNRS